jgi:mRNA interferase RelE/StbE
MSCSLVYLPGAVRDLRKLPEDVVERARRGLERLARNPELGNRLAEPLTEFWSYRVGDYRIVYQVRRRELLVLIVMIGHRRGIYERARRLLG